MKTAEPSRWLTLDALRGTGSLAVVAYHLGFAGTFAANGYLAVDFFFLMSGVVITRAYQAKVEKGMSTAEFMIERIIRFYPFYVLALLVGVGRKALQIMVGHPQEMPLSDLMISTLLNVLMLPSPVTRELTPMNVVTWSLHLELLINVIWAGVLVKMPRRTLAACLAVLGVVLGLLIVSRGSSGGGAEWKDVHMGVIRGFFGFVLGIVMAQSITPRVPRESGLAIVAVILLCTLFVVDIAPGHRVVYDLFSIFVCFPVVMHLALSFDPPGSLKGVARFLGEVSFPVYTLHFGVLYGGAYLAQKFGIGSGIGPGLWIPAFIVVLLGVSIVLARTYDPAARRYLRGVLARRRVRLAPVICDLERSASCWHGRSDPPVASAPDGHGGTGRYGTTDPAVSRPDFLHVGRIRSL